MENMAQENLHEIASRWVPAHQIPRRFQIHTDTTDFFRIEYGDVVVLGGKPYLIRHNAQELRFRLEEEVKFWVKRAIDMEDGKLKILKLIFHEGFTAHIIGMEFECGKRNAL